jgi:hypothetical protein
LIQSDQTILEGLQNGEWQFERNLGGYLLGRPDSRFIIKLASAVIPERLDIGPRWHLIVDLGPGNPSAEDEAALMRLPKLDTAIMRGQNDRSQQYVRWAPFSSHYANAEPSRVSAWVLGAMGTISERLLIEPSEYLFATEVVIADLPAAHQPEREEAKPALSEAVRNVLNSIPDVAQRVTTLDVLIEQGITTESDAKVLRAELLLELHDPTAIESVVLAGGVIEQKMAEDFIINFLTSPRNISRDALKSVCSDEGLWADKDFSARLSRSVDGCRSNDALSALFLYSVDFAPSSIAFRIGMKAIETVVKETEFDVRMRIVEAGTKLSGDWADQLVSAALDQSIIRAVEACSSKLVAEFVGRSTKSTNELVRQVLLKAQTDDALAVVILLLEVPDSQMQVDSLARLIVWLENKAVIKKLRSDQLPTLYDAIEKIAELQSDYPLGNARMKVLTALRGLQEGFTDAEGIEICNKLLTLLEPSSHDRVAADALTKAIAAAKDSLAGQRFVVVGGRPPAHLESLLEAFGLSAAKSIHWVRASRDKAPTRDEIWAPITGGRCVGVLNVLDCGHRTSDLAKQATTSAGVPLVQVKTNSRRDLQSGLIRLAAALGGSQ